MKNWHPEAGLLAKLRYFWWWVVRRWETEICRRCGCPVRFVWHAPTPLWLAASGYPDKGGCLCMPCFDGLMERAGMMPTWEVADRDWPSCHGHPCPHEETMLFQRGEIEKLWNQLQQLRAEGR